MTGRFTVTYHVRSGAAAIEARAQGIAVEQSVEMPLAAIEDDGVLTDIVGGVEAIDDLGDGVFAVRIGLAHRDGRARRRAVPEHDVRQYVAARGRRAEGCRRCPTTWPRRSAVRATVSRICGGG